MSNVSIFQKSWADIVFEGRNKSYGAYQLRNENPRTTLTALFLAITSLIAIGGIVFLLQGIKETSTVEKPFLDEQIIVTPYHHQPPPPRDPVVKSLPVEKKTADDDKKDIIDPVVVPADGADDVRTNEETRTSSDDNEQQGETASLAESTSGSGSTSGSVSTETLPVDPNGIVPNHQLDRLPEFPGGINKFYKYVGNNFERPDREISGNKTVMLSFVIERDGTMTDIKVIRSAGSEIDLEAVRVLKSLRTKWKAGLKDGQPVRTLYMLPITVNEMHH